MLALRDRFRRRRVVEDRDGDGRVDRDPDRNDAGLRRNRGAAAARNALARIIGLITLLVVLTIVLGIVLVVLKANPDNAIVDAIREAAKYLSKPFDAIFEMDKRRTEIAVNWGIAAVVYLIAGRVLARVVSR
jgi:hypothetical protein